MPLNVTCHTLRHSFASHLNDEEVDVLVIQELLGHATPKTTSDYYIHSSLKSSGDVRPDYIFLNCYCIHRNKVLSQFTINLFPYVHAAFLPA